jgi:hypothetical protein
MRLVCVLLLLLFGGRAVMAEDLVDFDPKDTKVVLNLPEFSGLTPRIAKRSPLRRGPAAMATLEYLVYSDDTRLAVINHQTVATPGTWDEIDLEQYIRGNQSTASLEKTFEAAEPYARSGASGRLLRYTMREATESMGCLAFDVKGSLSRLIGFLCLPGSAGLSSAEAKRLIDGIGVTDTLPPV